MSFFGKISPMSVIPPIVLTVGILTFGSGFIMSLIPKGKLKSPWTSQKPLVIGVFIPPPRPQSLPLSAVPPEQPSNGSRGDQQQPSSGSFLPRKKENYERLAEQLKQELQKQFDGEVQVKVDAFTPNVTGAGSSLLESLRQKIKTKEWDIAFTVIPNISVVARENDYTHAARMFPKNSQIDYILYVRKDSSIQSEQDFTSDTKLALGEVGSEALFYLPVYDLYGRTLIADVGNSPPTIMRKVMQGEVDVGVGIAQFLKTRPELSQQFRVLREGRALPPAGVYLSPTQKEYHDQLKSALLNMPKSVQEDANYAQGDEVNYQYMVGVVKRAEEIIGCREWTSGVAKTVQFFCTPTPTPMPTPTLPEPPADGIVGKANGYSLSGDDVLLKLQGIRPSNEIYTIIIPRRILNIDPGLNMSVPRLNGQYLHVANSIKPTSDSPPKLKIEDQGQLKLVRKP